jgi:UDP-N-acetylglucosamine 2-epimerase (non-hydrolysing)
MRAIKVVTVFGTRPESVKMAPLVSKMEESDYIESIVCVTAQHRQMLDQVLKVFEISPHHDLDIMKNRQSLLEITTRALSGLDQIFRQINPDLVLVHGDTTTTFAGSLAAFYNQIKVGHVEAGLRTFNKYFPYPEEMNRKLTGSLTDIHFAPTITNQENLLKEGVDPSKIYITGNTVIDALKTTVREDYQFSNLKLQKLDFINRKVLTVTAHRRENLGEPLEDICGALRIIAEEYKDVTIVYPVHLNPQVKETATKYLEGLSNVYLIDPLDVQDMHNLMARSYFILTDSGGLQEEAPSLGKPVLVLRNETERPEAVQAGTVKIAGTKKERILDLTRELLEDGQVYRKMAKAINPYGDGLASSRIVDAILYEFGITNSKPGDFGVG